MAEQLISVTPDPPVAGESLTICYSASAANPPPSLNITLTPPGPPDEVRVPPNQDPRCETITVPLNATNILIDDPSGQSQSFGSAVRPGGGGDGPDT